jgi:hypothetical protein
VLQLLSPLTLTQRVTISLGCRETPRLARAHLHSMAPSEAPFFTLFLGSFRTTASSHPGGPNGQVLFPLLIRTTACTPLSSSASHLLGLITTRSLPLLYASSRSSHYRILHHHGKAKSHGRGATYSDRIQWLQDGTHREEEGMIRDHLLLYVTVA